MFGFCTVSSQVLIKYVHPGNQKTYTMFAENRYNWEKKIGLFKSMIGPYLGMKSMTPIYGVDTVRRFMFIK